MKKLLLIILLVLLAGCNTIVEPCKDGCKTTDIEKVSTVKNR